jgi:hypothetical protein
MNHHADKPYPAEVPLTARDKSVDSIVLEVHACPACGAIATRLLPE